MSQIKNSKESCYYVRRQSSKTFLGSIMLFNEAGPEPYNFLPVHMAQFSSGS